MSSEKGKSDRSKQGTGGGRTASESGFGQRHIELCLWERLIYDEHTKEGALGHRMPLIRLALATDNELLDLAGYMSRIAEGTAGSTPQDIFQRLVHRRGLLRSRVRRYPERKTLGAQLACDEAGCEPAECERKTVQTRGQTLSADLIPDSPALLTSSDVAHLLGVHINTIRRWNNEGKLRAYRVGARGDRRFSWDDVALFLDAQQETLQPGDS